MKARIAFLATKELNGNNITFLENLIKLQEDQFDIDLITGTSIQRNSISDHVNVLVYPWEKSVAVDMRFAFKALYRYLKNNNPSRIINLSHPVLSGLAVAILGLLFRVKYWIRVTGDIYGEKERATGFLARFRRILVYDVVLTFFFKKAEKVFVLGKKTYDDCLKKSYNENKIVLLPQPIDLSYFSKDQQSTNKKKKILNLDVGKKVLLYVGTLHPMKGAENLRHIIQGVLSQSRDFQFIIIGEGPYRESLQQLESHDVRLLGFLGREEVAKYFEVADLFVYPTKTDAMPNVLLESLASGTPIISRHVGEIPTITANLLDTNEEFVQFILKGNYPLDEIPTWFDWEAQRKRYSDGFSILADD